MDDNMTRVAQELCEAVDWERPELAGFAGESMEAALAFIRHLRRRERPLLGYSAEYVAQLRANAMPEFREQSAEDIRRILGVAFMGGDWPDGRGTLLTVRPEVLQVAGRAEDFLQFAHTIAAARAAWQKTAMHSIMGTVRYLQTVWPLAECPDEAVLPLLAFLAFKLPVEWESARRWNDTSHGTSGHNWYTAQFGATWKAALFFPEFKGFSRFLPLYPDYFERELRLLLFPDGFTHEASVAYHSGTMDLFLDVVHLAELNGLPFSEEARGHLRDGYATEWKLLCPDGGQPPFGDCWFRGPYFLGRARSIAALLGIPEAKYLAEKFDPEWRSPFGKMFIEALHYPSVGEDLAPAYQALESRAPDAADTVLPDSGYYVMRQNWTRDADYCAIEATVKGNVVTSHGHGAIFDTILYSRGRQITVGNGKGPDGVDDPERTWRHQTMSHTVAVVDGEHHLPLRSVYRFNGVVLPTVDEWESTPDYAYFSGVHEAYERLPKKVTGSRRKIFYLRGGYWILIDRFTGAQPEDEHTYQQRFQMGVPCRLLDDERVVTEGEGGNLLFVPVAGARGTAALERCPYPLGEDYANPDQLTFTIATGGRMLFATVLVPFVGAEMPDVQARLLEVTGDERVLTPWEVTGLEIVINGRRDVYVDQHQPWNLPWSCGGHAGSGRLFHSGCLVRS
ncbi:MAG: heparinase II/III domain-containing protein [Armatimonadota bacterium]